MNKILLTAFLLSFFCAVYGAMPFFKAPEQMAAREWVTNHLFNVADLNGDGKKDLIFLNAGHENMFVCWNTGSNTAPVFGHAERLWLNLTETVPEGIGDAASFQMIDFDKDGDLDIFTWDYNHAGPQGAGWVKNTGSAQSYKYDSSSHFGITETRQYGDNLKHAYTADWDRDGRLDLIVYDFFRTSNICLTWYRNTSSGGAAVFGPRRVFRTSAQPDTFINAPRPTVVDWNNDGLLDVVGGGGQADFDQGDRKIRVWRGTAVPDSLAAPAVIDSVLGGTSFIVHDWNGDGKKDLMIMDTLAFFRIYLNIGTDEAPRFRTRPDTLRGRDFCHSDKWAAQLLDWNKDGRLDLVYGGAFNQMCSAVWARVRLYLDQAGSGEPDFRQGRFLSCNGMDIKSNWGLWGRTMTFVEDMDADNDWDLFFAYRYATPIAFYQYKGGPSTAQTLAFESESPVTYGASLDTFNTDMHPRVCDMDNDGLKDLLIGVDGGDTRDGRIWLYRNTGTPAAPVFAESSVRLLLTNQNQDNASFAVCDMDGDMLKDIIVGCDTGNVRVYRNTGTASSPSFSVNEYLKFESGANIGNPSYPWHMRSDGTVSPGANVVCAGDYDYDGVPDLLCTISWVRHFTQWLPTGGFYLLRGSWKGSAVESENALIAPDFSVLPNPFHPDAVFRLKGGAALKFPVIAVYDAAGRMAYESKTTVQALRAGFRWTALQLPNGVYTVRITDTGRFIKSARAVLLR